MSAAHPSPLFKYRDDSARTEQIITNGKVWLATASQLNDPLECKAGQIPDQWKRKHIRKMENAQMCGFVMSAVPALKGEASFYSLSSGAAKRWFKRFKSLKTRKGKYAAVRSFLRDHGNELSRPSELFEKFEKQLAQVGVFSLSECPDNQLMWAHYAASHTGLAIGFGSVSGSKLTSSEHTLKVVYSDTKPTFNDGFISRLSMRLSPGAGITSEQKIGFSDLTFRAAFSTKPEVWSYEKEWRYVEESHGLFPWPGPIESVVFGLKMPLERRKHYACLISKAILSPVKLFQIKLAANNARFEMIPWSTVSP